MHSGPAAPAEFSADSPLYVDLDGTLAKTDLLFESALQLLRRQPLAVFALFAWALRGRAALKRALADRVDLDPALLPYHADFVAWLRAEGERGRRLYLASASEIRPVQRVADHLNLFADVLATERDNLKGARKAAAIVDHARAQGAGAFAYAGNAAADLPVWAQASEVVVVNAPASVARRARRAAQAAGKPVREFGQDSGGDDATTNAAADAAGRRRDATGWRAWLRALRPHQWAKNLLLFVPMAAAHTLAAASLRATLLGFVAFCLCASATYVINDLLDLQADRIHPRKRHRPFANGALAPQQGVLLAAVLLPAAAALGWAVSPLFLGVLGVYAVGTLAYSFGLKRTAFVDVLVLAGLYTLRVFAGGVASAILVSNWLLAISGFLFLSLALVKRCAELEDGVASGRDAPAARGYLAGDLPYLIAMGIASGFVAVMVLALYVDSQNGAALYTHPQLLWLACPLLLAWLMRLWIKTARREMHDDPVLFALRDRFSWGIGAGVLAIATLAYHV